MADVRDILHSYGSAARAKYPQGDDVEDDMNYIVDFINQHGYEFEEDLFGELRRGLDLCPIRDVFKDFDCCSECRFAVKRGNRYVYYECGFKGYGVLMDTQQYRNIQEKVRKLHEHVDPRGCLELLAEESSDVTQAAMKLIRVSEAANDKVYPADKNKYNIKNCEVALNNEIMDVITCVFLLQAAHYDVPNSLMDYDVINERLDKMIARIEENENE